MAWSTREIAELAGTSLRAVRHYHDIGLLPEPERRSNGYKQYGVTHLMRLLRITKLVTLGFSLHQIADLGDGDEHPAEALRALDADLARQIEQRQRLRAELAEILGSGLATDLPSEFAGARKEFSEADRNFIAVIGRVLGKKERAAYAELLTDEARMESDDDFDALPADADETTRQELAERLAAEVRRLSEQFPAVKTLGAETTVGPRRYRETLDRAIGELYNPAQRDVMRRMRLIYPKENG
jgi:DNA-binding transcriptional MerR regulator